MKITKRKLNADVAKITQAWKKIGWYDRHDYYKACDSTEEGQAMRKKFQKYKNALDPDVVNPHTFWKATDVHFGVDTVCNGMPTHSSKLIPKELTDDFNLQNFHITVFSGMLGRLEWAKMNCIRKFGRVDLAEIGCGYGAFYENYAKNPENNIKEYTGFDVVKRTDYTTLVGGRDGTFSHYQVNKYRNKFNIFFSCNVFQHLSKKQITKYLKQMHEMLPPGGYIVISYVHTAARTYHYGQIVELFSEYEFFQTIANSGFGIIGSTKDAIIGQGLPIMSVIAERLVKK